MRENSQPLAMERTLQLKTNIDVTELKNSDHCFRADLIILSPLVAPHCPTTINPIIHLLQSKLYSENYLLSYMNILLCKYLLLRTTNNLVFSEKRDWVLEILPILGTCYFRHESLLYKI